MTKRIAKELVLKKWEWIVKHGHTYRMKPISEMEFELLRAVPALLDIRSGCGYCEKYGGCHECPIPPLDSGFDCWDMKSVYRIWLYKRTKKNAQAMLDLVRKT